MSSSFTDRNETSSLQNPSSQNNLGFVKQSTDILPVSKTVTPRETDNGTFKYNLTEKSSPPKYSRTMIKIEP